MSSKFSWTHLVILLIGLALGLSLSWCNKMRWHHSPMDHEKRYTRMLNHLQRKLDLNAEQKAKVGEILQTKREKIKALRSEIRPKFEELRHSANQEIRQILTPEQQKKFDQIQERWQKRRRHFHKD